MLAVTPPEALRGCGEPAIEHERADLARDDFVEVRVHGVDHDVAFQWVGRALRHDRQMLTEHPRAGLPGIAADRGRYGDQVVGNVQVEDAVVWERGWTRQKFRNRLRWRRA